MLIFQSHIYEKFLSFYDKGWEDVYWNAQHSNLEVFSCFKKTYPQEAAEYLEKARAKFNRIKEKGSNDYYFKNKDIIIISTGKMRKFPKLLYLKILIAYGKIVTWKLPTR